MIANIPWRSQSAIIDTNIKNCRDIIPNNFLAIMRFLKAHKWSLKYTTHAFLENDDIGLLKAELNYRNDTSIASFQYGYFTPNDATSVNNNARRLAELCLQVNENLPHYYPAKRIAENGFLYPDFRLKWSAHTSADALYDYEHELIKNPEQDSAATIHLRLGFLNLSCNNDSHLLGAHELSQLKDFLNERPDS